MHTSPQFLLNLATKLRQHSGSTALAGVGAIVAITFVSVFLAITLIGIPLISLLILTAIIISLVGSLGVALFVGECLIRQGNRSLQQQFLVGLAIVTLLTLIPFFGGLVVFLVNLFGLVSSCCGSLVERSLKQRRSKQDQAIKLKLETFKG